MPLNLFHRSDVAGRDFQKQLIPDERNLLQKI